MCEPYWKYYKHVRCTCGGVIGMYNKKNYTCGDCGAPMDPYIHFDKIMISGDKTGWAFPMIKKEMKEIDICE